MESGKEPAGLVPADFIDLTEATDGDTGSGSDGIVLSPITRVALIEPTTAESNTGSPSGSNDDDPREDEHDSNRHHGHRRVLTGRIAKTKMPVKKTATAKKTATTRKATITALTPNKGKGKGKSAACANCRKLKARCDRVTACERCLRLGQACSSSGESEVFIPGYKGKACEGCRKVKAKCVKMESCVRCEQKGLECLPFAD